VLVNVDFVEWFAIAVAVAVAVVAVIFIVVVVVVTVGDRVDSGDVKYAIISVVVIDGPFVTVWL